MGCVYCETHKKRLSTMYVRVCASKLQILQNFINGLLCLHGNFSLWSEANGYRYESVDLQVTVKIAPQFAFNVTHLILQ